MSSLLQGDSRHHRRHLQTREARVMNTVYEIGMAMTLSPAYEVWGIGPCEPRPLPGLPSTATSEGQVLVWLSTFQSMNVVSKLTCAISSPLMNDMLQTTEIAPRSGTAFKLERGQVLTVIDPQGEQVSDLLAFNAHDPREVISNGRTLDYASKLYLSTGDPLYSNRSNVMLKIVEDTCGRHDFLLTPCSKDTFRIIYGHEDPHQGCFGNLAEALTLHGIGPDQIPCAFNCFMNVPIDGKTGTFTVEPPLSKAGDHIDFLAEMDLVIGLTACSAGLSNGGSFKPIQYRIS